MRIDELHKPRKYNELKKAELDALILSEGDDEWDYKVILEGEVYMIEIEDKETGDFVGYF